MKSLKEGLSSNALKCIALVFMFIDHIGAFIDSTPIFFRWIGRLSAPLFIFCCVWSFHFTHNKEKYMLRLYIASVLMSIIQIFIHTENNIFRTLFYLCIILYLIDAAQKKKNFTKYLLIFLTWQILSIFITLYIIIKSRGNNIAYFFLPALLGNPLLIEGGLIIIALGIIFYLTRNDSRKLTVAFFVYDIIYTLVYYLPVMGIIQGKISRIFENYYSLKENLLFITDVLFSIIGIFPTNGGGGFLTDNYQWMIIFSLIPILSFNGKKGGSFKWFFYFFYPIHILILHFIGARLT